MHIASSLLFWLPLAEASLGGIIPRQTDKPGQVNCKEESFSDPRWYLYDPNYIAVNYTSGGTHGDFGVTVYNLVTYDSFECFAKNINLAPPSDEFYWYNCSAPDTQFRFNLTANVLELRQTWLCADAPTVPFIADGSLELPMTVACWDEFTARGEENACLYGSPVLLSADLTSPVNINPFYPWLPREPYEFPKRCADRSYYPTWQVDGLLYDHTEPQQSLTFNLTNLSNGGRVSCSVVVNDTLTRSTRHSERWLDCGAQHSSLTPGDISGTEILLDHEYGLLGIKQVWKCHDDVVEENDPDSYSGLGYLVTGLDCTTPIPYGGSESADTVKYTCSLPSTNITGYRSDDIPTHLPHTSYTRSCTMNSMNSTSLALKGYQIESYGALGKNASFTVYNPGSGDRYELANMPIQDDAIWHKCVPGSSSLPWQLLTCEYLLDRTANNIGFRFQWFCDDRDPFHAILFNVTASGHFPKEQCETVKGNDSSSVSCGLPADSTDVQLKVSTLSWTSTKQPMDRGPSLPWV